jgi:shikimate kinase
MEKVVNGRKNSCLIFLTGFMGCGKTTLGRKLSARLNCPFIDLDHVIEEKEGMTIAQYFSRFGEDAFRQLESNILKHTLYPDCAVVSTGGGLPCYFDNMEWMNAYGKTVYIKMPAKALADRLEQGNDDRPVLQHKKGNELLQFISEKLDEREFFYKQAAVIADGLSLTAEKLDALLF